MRRLRRWNPARHPRDGRTGRFVRLRHRHLALLLLLVLLAICALLIWVTHDRGKSDNHPKPAPAVSDNDPTPPGAVPSSHLTPMPIPPVGPTAPAGTLGPAAVPTSPHPSPEHVPATLPICKSHCG